MEVPLLCPRGAVLPYNYRNKSCIFSKSLLSFLLTSRQSFIQILGCHSSQQQRGTLCHHVLCKFPMTNCSCHPFPIKVTPLNAFFSLPTLLNAQAEFRATLTLYQCLTATFKKTATFLSQCECHPFPSKDTSGVYCIVYLLTDAVNRLGSL